MVFLNTFAQKVAAQLDNKVMPEEIQAMMTSSQIEETLAFQVNVTSTDKQLATDVANAIANTCPDEIVRILKVGGVEVIDYASVPDSPSSPNLQKNILIGLLFSFAVSFVFFFIKELFDTSITDEKDLEREFDIPILGICGISVCPNDASEEVKEICDHISNKNGGKGCVRELIEQVMKIHGKWNMQ